MLPIRPLAEDTVTVAGEEVAIRSLSRDEVVTLAAFGADTSAAEVFMLSRACSIPEEEAREWRTKVDAETAGILLAAIGALSGLKSGNARPSSRRLNGR